MTAHVMAHQNDGRLFPSLLEVVFARAAASLFVVVRRSWCQETVTIGDHDGCWTVGFGTGQSDRLWLVALFR